MKIGNIDVDKQVFIVAEIGNNHEGDFSLAQELVGRAAEAGADAVKFQTFIPEHYVSNADTGRLERLRKFQLSFDQFEGLAKLSKQEGLVFFSTPFDLESARFLNNIQPIFKISSGDNNFFPLIDLVFGFGKPTIISTGLADMPLLVTLYEFWKERSELDNLAFLHCISSYPTPTDQVNLFAIHEMKRQFPDVTIGYSDHTLGTRASTLAVASGAQIIEKHFTLDKNYSEFHDHKLSADPEEMKILVESVREASVMMGKEEKSIQQCEENSVMAMRRSIAASRDLDHGVVLTETDITWTRPGTGIPPGEEKRVLGRRTARSIEQGELIQMEDLSR